MEFKLSILLLTLSFAIISINCQKVPPGVPPQQYQNQDYQQQNQFQQHQQYQQPQVPQQYGHGQAVPMQQPHQIPQQIPQQVPQHGQVPQHHQQQQLPGQQPHHHGHQKNPQQFLDVSNIGQERDHIKEHMDVPLDTSNMSEQELQFHYFKMHDSDNNNKLDGCELVKSLIHWHDSSNHDPRSGVPAPEAKIFQDDELINMIDPILQNDDKNKDGFIDYGEFVQAQAAAASRHAGQPGQPQS